MIFIIELQLIYGQFMIRIQIICRKCLPYQYIFQPHNKAGFLRALIFVSLYTFSNRMRSAWWSNRMLFQPNTSNGRGYDNKCDWILVRYARTDVQFADVQTICNENLEDLRTISRQHVRPCGKKNQPGIIFWMLSFFPSLFPIFLCLHFISLFFSPYFYQIYWIKTNTNTIQSFSLKSIFSIFQPQFALLQLH